MSERSVVIDANIFVRTWLLDPVLSLADEAFLNPYWSSKIMEETYRALLEHRHHQDGSRLRRYLEVINRAYPKACVDGWESRISSIALPDPDDRHVVAAALVAKAAVIVTYNVGDFPEEELSQFGIRAEHPDVLLSRMFDSASDEVSAIILRMVNSKKHPPRTVREQIDYLVRAQCPEFAGRLRRSLLRDA